MIFQARAISSKFPQRVLSLYALLRTFHLCRYIFALSLIAIFVEDYNDIPNENSIKMYRNVGHNPRNPRVYRARILLLFPSSLDGIVRSRAQRDNEEGYNAAGYNGV